jgi:hypothetical protein
VRPVEGRQPGPLAQRHVQRGDVGVAEERLGVLGDQVEVQVGQELHGAEPAGEALDDVDLGVGEHRLQVAGAALGAAGDIAVARLDAVGQLHPVAAGLPPFDPAEQVGAVLPGTGRRRHTDAAAFRQRPAEPARRDRHNRGSGSRRCGSGLASSSST